MGLPLELSAYAAHILRYPRRGEGGYSHFVTSFEVLRVGLQQVAFIIYIYYIDRLLAHKYIQDTNSNGYKNIKI